MIAADGEGIRGRPEVVMMTGALAGLGRVLARVALVAVGWSDLRGRDRLEAAGLKID